VAQTAWKSPEAPCLDRCSPRLSIIVPVYNTPQDLRESLSALISSSCPGSEIIVVDDASTNDTPFVAAQMGVRVLQLAKHSGPAAVRNYGASQEQGDILFFVDADVVIASDVLRRVVEVFATRPDLAPAPKASFPNIGICLITSNFR
jgi:glycosyltransferase involved in cell wall biosynthesis